MSRISLAEALDLTDPRPLPAPPSLPQRLLKSSTLLVERCTCQRCQQTWQSPIGVRSVWKVRGPDGWTDQAEIDHETLCVPPRGKIAFVARTVLACPACWKEEA